jgi:6-phosphogluconolactonase
MGTGGMNTDRPEYLPECVSWHSSISADSLSIDLSTAIKKMLQDAILKDGRASLAVSGGSTPKTLFKKISKMELDWSSIDITLVDDRWVDREHKDSNELLVRRFLLKGNAADASFVALKNSSDGAQEGQQKCEQSLRQIKQPLDVAVLGLGTDGHTASLFPCSEELAMAMDINNTNKCIATTPKSAPYDRITLTRSAISRSDNIILHIVGHKKLDTLEQAIKTKDSAKMPIYAFLQEPISIYWSP